MRKITVFLFLLASVLRLSAQERCAVVAYKNLLQNNPKRESEEQFEQWIQNKIKIQRKQSSGIERINTAPSIMPVVVHVIHNGEPIGTGANISDAQIISQINVLNKDYQRLNADANQTPAEFQSVAGAFNVQFVLAKRDPESLPTNGIVRVKGTKSGWTMAEDAELKSMSYWNSEDYLNIWVTNIDDPAGFIGYAKFPVSTLPDLANSPNDPLTDGVVIHYDAFGSSDDGNFNLDSKYNKGRTTTHEVGHFFGLYHIWGDDSGGCSGTDYVTDTPNQGNNYNGSCPSHPQIGACSSHDMFQNYMDYTNDACMNIFTVGQVDRMVTVLENSPRRASLTTSKGAIEPPVLSIDLGIKSILTPVATTCAGSIVPTLKIRSYGTTLVTSARIQVKFNGIETEIKDFVLNLSNLAETTIDFNTITIPANTTAQLSFEIIQVNGQADENVDNNLRSVTFTTPQTTTLPVLEPFNTVTTAGVPTGWSLQNPDALATWQNLSAPVDGASNKVMSINLFDYEDEGAVDRLVTPVMDFSNLTSATLKFDRAYAQFPGRTGDILRVLVSTDCGANLNQATEIFNKSGTTLATSANTTSAFIPVTQSQWAKENISLAQFKGNPSVQLIFEVTNGYGNNIYLDNVQVLITDLVDLALVKIVNPSPVICITNPPPSLTVKNFGSQTITSFKLSSTVSGITKSSDFTGLSLIPGGELTVQLDPLALKVGTNTIRFELSEPNSSPDARTDNDLLELRCVVNQIESGIPLREKFEADFSSSWTTVSQGDQEPFGVATTNFGKSIVYPGFTNTTRGEEAWLVSPVLDLSRTLKASMFYDLSYAKRATGNERLRVLGSHDCGVTFPIILFDQSGDSFSIASSSSAWTPSGNSDWKNQFIYLDDLLGGDHVRLAFIVTNDNGNNLYLDNIEFFIDDDPSPVQINSLYKVYPAENSSSSFQITFNLPEKEDAYLQIYNLMGQIIVDNVLPETLNQTYTVDFGAQASGLYIVKVQTSKQFESTKIFLTH